MDGMKLSWESEAWIHVDYQGIPSSLTWGTWVGCGQEWWMPPGALCLVQGLNVVPLATGRLSFSYLSSWAWVLSCCLTHVPLCHPSLPALLPTYRLVPALGPLHLLCSLKHLPTQVSAWLPACHQSDLSSHVTSSERPALIYLAKMSPPSGPLCYFLTQWFSILGAC